MDTSKKNLEQREKPELRIALELTHTALDEGDIESTLWQVVPQGILLLCRVPRRRPQSSRDEL